MGYWALALMVLLLLQNIWQDAWQVETVPCSAFEQALADGHIAGVVIPNTTVTGKLVTPDGHKTALVAVRVEPDFAQRLERCKVPHTRVVQNTLVRDLMS